MFLADVTVEAVCEKRLRTEFCPVLLEMATRIIRIASSKPSVVFGVPHPTDTIQRWLDRSYQSMLDIFFFPRERFALSHFIAISNASPSSDGFFTTGKLLLGCVPIFGGAWASWYFSVNMTGYVFAFRIRFP